MPQKKLALNLPLLLPEVRETRNRVVHLLVDALDGKTGIEKAHVDGEGTNAKLCIHYDPDRISLSELRRLALGVGTQLTDEIGQLTVEGNATHARAARRLEYEIDALPGVLEARVSASGAAHVEFVRKHISRQQLLERLGELGFVLREPERVEEGHDHDHGDEHGHDHGDEHEHDHAHEHEHEHEHGHEHDDAHEHGHDHDDHGHDHDHDHDHDHGHGHDHDHEHEDAHDHGHAKADSHDHSHAGHSHSHHGHSHSHGGPFGERSELIFALLAGVALLTGWLLSRAHAASAGVTTAFYLAAYLFGAWFTVREAIENLKARQFQIETLMLVAAAGAAVLGKWAEGGLLLFLFSLGHSLEHYAMGRARKAIEALAKLAPETAHLKQGERIEEVPIAKLNPGDIVVVRPHERLPMDGIVAVGSSAVNQAPVTGESVPVDKQPHADPRAAIQAFERAAHEHRVFAGTINGAGLLEVMVARRAGESTMARVARLVTEAEAQRSPTQSFTDKFERIFAPAVLGLVVLLMFAWVIVDEPFAASFYRAMAVLVAASPCALAISVPSAVLSGVARAGREGVLVKGGAPLEDLGSLTAIAFDKTGTLTEGKPRLTDAVPAAGVDERELLAVALAVELHSDHPCAFAIVSGARERLGHESRPGSVTAVESITGKGIRAQHEGEFVHIGKPALFDGLPGAKLPQALADENRRLTESGRTTMIVRRGERYLGVLGVMDTPRPEAAGVMLALKRLGIRRLIMISGDNQRVADAVAKSVGLTEAQGDLMPDDKVTAIKALRGDAGRVAMVGDGVNDAPALATATVGISMGAAGSDVALETADVALMADDLAQLPLAVGLSRATSRIIRQNLFVSLGVVALLVPATILGLGIGTAVIFHEGSTLVVVFNALRLLAYRRPADH